VKKKLAKICILWRNKVEKIESEICAQIFELLNTVPYPFVAYTE
jgi:hypothetical protein